MLYRHSETGNFIVWNLHVMTILTKLINITFFFEVAGFKAWCIHVATVSFGTCVHRILEKTISLDWTILIKTLNRCPKMGLTVFPLQTVYNSESVRTGLTVASPFPNHSSSTSNFQCHPAWHESFSIMELINNGIMILSAT